MDCTRQSFGEVNDVLLFFIGGAISWLIAMPLMDASGYLTGDATALDAAWDLWSHEIRYIGVGESVEDLRPFEARQFIDALFARDDAAA